MCALTRFLANLGLERYADVFAREDITLDLLPQLSDSDLTELGVTVGHRVRIRQALAAMRAESSIRADQAALERPPQKPPPRDTERRPLSLMFCDLVDSVHLSRRLGAEGFRTVLNAYQDVCSQAIRGYGGYPARFIGDGVLAYFGYPVAHEDDAERALRAGLAIIEGLPGLNTQLRQNGGPDLAVRIGIASGDVVVGDIIGTQSQELAAVTGDAPNLAARLQSVADRNSIVVDEPTRSRAAGQFEYRDLGTKMLKGFDVPVQVWQVVGESVATRFEARNRRPTRFVGRQHQLADLMRQWERARLGHGQTALISGRAGIGKSRITDAVRQQALLNAKRDGSPEPLPIRLQCSPYHINTPLHPLIRLLERMAGFERADRPQDRLSKLEQLIKRFQFDGGEECLPLLADLMSIPMGPSLLLSGGGREKRLKQLDLLQRWLQSLAMVQPVLLGFEDVQWIDPSTQQFLNRLVDTTGSIPILILLTLRSAPESADGSGSPAEDAGADWLLRPGVQPYEIMELNEAESLSLIADVAENLKVPELVATAISAKGQGIPLFLEELTRGWLMASGRSVADSASGPPQDAASALTIPDSLSSALMARVDQLGSAKEVALQAAVIGREFSVGLLSKVARMTESSARSILEDLVHADILKPLRSAQEPSYLFKHALIQDAAYGSLLTARRKDMHRQVALVLEEERATQHDIPLELIAQHYAKNSSPGKAIQLWRQAAEQAIAQSAQHEAARMLEQALALLPELPETPERLELELDLTSESAAALRATRGYAAADVEARYLRARELCDRCPSPRVRFNVDWGLFQCNLVKGELSRAEEFAESLLTKAAGLSDGLKADAYLATGMVRLHQGEFENARAFLEQAAGLTDSNHDSPHPFTHGQNPGIFCRSNLAHTLAFLGQADRARALVEENLSIAGARQAEPSHLYTFVNALAFASRVHMLLADPKSVERIAKELLRIAEKYHFTYYAAIAKACGKALQSSKVPGRNWACAGTISSLPSCTRVPHHHPTPRRLSPRPKAKKIPAPEFGTQSSSG